MKTINRIAFTLLAAFALVSQVEAQTAITNTTISAAITSTSATQFTVASATGFSVNYIAVMDNEARRITAINGLVISATRGASGTRPSTHISGSAVYVGPGDYFATYDRAGSCTAANELVSPVINVANGKRFTCTAGQWGELRSFYVPPTSCTFTPTTLTTTNTYVYLGANNILVLNGVSNAAAGTQTLACNIHIPTAVGVGRGAVLTDIEVQLGSQVVAPTSLGTSTLGSVTFATPVATTQTASVVTPVTIGGTVTTVGPTTTIATVTTAGAFLSFKHTYSTPVELNADRQILLYKFPILQSAASAMTLNTAGLIVHYQVR